MVDAIGSKLNTGADSNNIEIKKIELQSDSGNKTEVINVLTTMSEEGKPIDTQFKTVLNQLADGEKVENKMEELKRQAELEEIKRNIEDSLRKKSDEDKKVELTEETLEDLKKILKGDLPDGIEPGDISLEQRNEILKAVKEKLTELNGGAPLKEEAILKAELNMAIQQVVSKNDLDSNTGKQLESLVKKIV